MHDDGIGIADCGRLLAFGGSGWAGQQALDEDPAGMGLFSLARRHCTIVSRTATGAAWTVSLAPEHFERPEIAAEVRRAERGSVGTSVTFSAASLQHRDVAALARFYPLPVTFDGEELPRVEFLGGSVATEEWRGVRLGVFRGAGVSRAINFHGIVVDRPYAAMVSTVDGPMWLAAVDVDRAPELKLVLPARKEVVETGFLREMQGVARLAVYRTVALQGAPLIARLRQSEVARCAAHGGARISIHDVQAARWATRRPGFWFGAGEEAKAARAGVDTAAGERGIWATKAAGEVALAALVTLAARGVAIDDRGAFAALVLATQPAGAAPRGALLADESAWSVVSEAQRLLGGALRADGKLAWHAVSGPAALEPLRGDAETLEAAQRGCAAVCVDPRGLADWFAA